MKSPLKSRLKFPLLPVLRWVVAAGCAAGSFTASSADLLSIYKEAVANDAVYSSARYSLNAGLEKYPQGLATLLAWLFTLALTVGNSVEIGRAHV